MSWAQANGCPIFLFEAFDEPSTAVCPPAGSVEPHFGILPLPAGAIPRVPDTCAPGLPPSPPPSCPIL